MADDVDIKIGASYDDVVSGIGGAKDAISSLQNELNSLAAIIGISFSIDALKNFISSMEEVGVQTERTAAMLGMSVEETSRLNAISTLTGGSSDLLARAMERLAFNMQQASAGGQRQQDAFRQLGISYKDAHGNLLPLEEMLGKVADRFSTAPDGPEKTAISITLFTRAGAEMIPYLDRGAAGLKDLGDQAEATGIILDKNTATALERAHQKSVLMQDSITGLGLVLMKELIPSLNEANDWITKHIERLIAWENENQTLRKILQFFSQDTALPNVRVRLLEEAHALDDLKTSMGGVDAQMKTLTTDWVAFDAQLTGGAKPKTTPILPPTDFKAAQDAAKQVMQAIQSEMQVDNAFYEQQVEHINAAFKLGQITEQQKTQELISAVQSRLSVEVAAIDEAMKKEQGSAVDFQKLQGMEVEAKQKAMQDEQKIVDQGLEQEQKAYKTAADDIAGAFNSQLRGLLAGTTSWSTAIKNMLADMVLKFIEGFIKIGLEWAAQQAFMLVVQQSTQAAIAASQATGAAATLPLKVATFVSTITADAAVAFAGAFAETIPAGIPAATAAGSAAQGIVLAQLANVPKFDVGTDYVPHDMLAMVHQGEAITPASENPAAGGSASGGVQFHFNGPIIGSQAWINSMIPQLSRALQGFQQINQSA